MSPLSAAPSIISIYLRNKNDAIPSILSKPNSRIRAERHYGEVATSGTLHQDLRIKADAKVNKLSKQKGAQQSQRSTKKS